jgi:biopolymer transport protein ExbD
MKIRTPIAEKKSRLEIIPLIDIMFFLLASFMMITLQMQIVRTIKANLPTATLATSSQKPDIVNLNVNKDGQVSLDDTNIALPALFTILTNRYSLNTNLPVYITGANDATHGSVMFVLDFVRRAGIRNVALAVHASGDHSSP